MILPRLLSGLRQMAIELNLSGGRRNMEADVGNIQIAGTVKAVIYQNDENGYTVLRLESQDGQQLNAVGCLPFAAPGEQLILTGEWARHPTHGEQFKVKWAERVLPRSVSAIYEYLASRVVRGIGPATASLIVTTFGEKSLDIIENHPEKLAEIKGISLKKAREMSESLRRQTGLRRLMEFLNSHELRPQLAMKLYRYYGDGSLEILQANPYILSTEYIGADFNEADALALALGFDGDSAERVSAAVIYEMRYNANNGHCFIPRNKLITATAQLIEVSEDIVEEGLDILIDSGEVISEPLAGLDACYLQQLYEAETFTAERICAMAKTVYDEEIDLVAITDEIERQYGIKYAPAQKATLEIAARRQIMVLTGGPGTGKTTTVRAILALFDHMGLQTQLAAPTGRAAKRMSELTGREASTVHRLLEAGYSAEEDVVIFNRDEDDPLRCDAIILDECSMVDITLMRALLAAMPPECRLVLVGDADQLPSVGPGNVFLDIIRSQVVETVRLNEIFRQKEASRIVTCAHKINQGEHPDFGKNTGDLFFMKRMEKPAAIELITQLCSHRLPDNMGFDPMDIQVLSPTRKYETGTVNLNARLQQALNPPNKSKKERRFGEIIFREGDKVMQIRNNYDIILKDGDKPVGVGVFNGDIGRITAIDETDQTITVNFDGKTACYGFDMLSELEHAYAMTVHKAQGSEYRAVILSASGGTKMLLHRGVLYTAVTRARELLIIVGNNEVIDYMIDNHRQTRRYSGLRIRLVQVQQ